MSRMHEIRIDRNKPLSDEARTGHNRWHPDIPPVLRVEPGDQVVLETRDALDGFITPASTIADNKLLDLKRAHPLTGLCIYHYPSRIRFPDGLFP